MQAPEELSSSQVKLQNRLHEEGCMIWRQVPCKLQGAACRNRRHTEDRRQGNNELLLPQPSILWQVNKA